MCGLRLAAAEGNRTRCAAWVDTSVRLHGLVGSNPTLSASAMENTQDLEEETEASPQVKAPRRDVPVRWGGGDGIRESVRKDGFLAVPVVFLKSAASLGDYGLTPTETLFVIQLMSFKWGADAPYPSYKRLADRMGISTVYARKLAREIEKKGLIKRIVKQGVTNRFDLTPLFEALELVVNPSGGTSTPPF